MSKKVDNNLFLVADNEGFRHYFTSMFRIAEYFGTQRQYVENVMERKKRPGEFIDKRDNKKYLIVITDGSNVMYKDIN